MKEFIKTILIFIYQVLTWFVPVQRKTILFMSSNGRNYTGNPRYIYEEMVHQGLDRSYRCVWLLFDTNIEIPGNCRKVRCNYPEYFWFLMRARVWVFDSRQMAWFRKKRRNTIFIQTWHGTPLKKLGMDMNKMNMGGNQDIERYRRDFQDAALQWDFLVAQNRYSKNIFQSCFGFQEQTKGLMARRGRKFLEIGYPRNDILFHKNNPEDIIKLKRYLGLPMDKKVLLYAPTWRDDEFIVQGQYKFASAMDFDLMRRELSGEYVMIVKYHYLIQDQVDWTPYKDFIYTFDETKDIAWLYLVSDMMITDYSSVMFDYSILKRPMLFFAYDLDHYKGDLRDFYFSYESTVPGPVSKTTEQLVKDIQTYEAACWDKKYQRFEKKFNALDDGHASDKIVSIIRKACGK